MDQYPAYQLDAERNVWYPRSGAAAFAYNDGDAAEDYIHQAVLAASDLRTGSDVLTAAIKDWPSLYHLSPSRANLLRPIQHLLSGSVLELGSGCGAITRYLGELNSEVTAVEGGSRRAAITSARCRNLPNVAVICDHFNSLKLNRTFDCVLLVGVLEYCRLFESPPDPAARLLHRCRSLLSPGGRLIVAIENQYGLKYFCGVPEDHLSQPFAGIENRYSHRSPVTWSRAELLNMLHAAGFPEVSELYPFPDYKIPAMVFTKSSLDYGDLPGELLRSHGATLHSAMPYAPTFSETAVWPGLVRANLVPELTNSFLLIASNAPQLTQGGVYCYSTERLRAFHRQTLFKSAGTGLTVNRSRLFDDPLPAGRLRWHVPSGGYRAGRLYSTVYHGIVARAGWTLEQLIDCIAPFYRFLMSRALPSTSETESGPYLSGNYISCVPGHTILTGNGDFHWFNDEFEWTEPLPLRYILFRGIYGTLAGARRVSPTRHVPDLRLSALARSVLSGLGEPVTSHELADFLNREAEFTLATTGTQVTQEVLITRLLSGLA